jgi:DNA-binding transcriptional ArsR family regulator
MPDIPDQAPITNISDPRWVRAIAHPLRIRILAILDETTASPVMLAAVLNQPLGIVAYHVRVLFDLGLLELASTKQRRGATEHYYRTIGHPRFTDEAWADLDTVSKQRVLTAVLNKAHDYATRAAAAGGFDAPDAHFTATPLKLDKDGWTELAAATKTWLETTARLEHEAAERLAKAPHSEIAAGIVILLFEAVPVFGDMPSASDERHRPVAGGGPSRRRERNRSSK